MLQVRRVTLVVAVTIALCLTIAAPTHAFDDCQPNGIPDECDLTCDPPCDVFDCGDSEDCQPNGIPDECDIEVGSSAPGGPYFCCGNCSEDCNRDGIPDECQVPSCEELEVVVLVDTSASMSSDFRAHVPIDNGLCDVLLQAEATLVTAGATSSPSLTVKAGTPSILKR